MINGTTLVLTVGGGLLAAMFSIIHALQNRRLNRVEENKTDEKTCKVRHEGIDDKLENMKDMVQYLYDDRRDWKKKNGHEV